MKRIVTALMLILTLMMFITSCQNNYKDSKVTKEDNTIVIENITIDKNYLLAINSANQFLNAWLMRDQNKGVEFITESLKNSLSEQELFAFFVGTSNPHHQGYEIIGKEHIDDTTIRFSVWLYEDITNQAPQPYKRGEPLYIDVVKSTEYIWLVNNLPKK